MWATLLVFSASLSPLETESSWAAAGQFESCLYKASEKADLAYRSETFLQTAKRQVSFALGLCKDERSKLDATFGIDGARPIARIVTRRVESDLAGSAEFQSIGEL